MKDSETLVRVVACGACVYRYNTHGLQLLLVRPFAERDSWGIPKGHKNGEESIEECALREVREETGLDVILEDRLTVAYTRYRNERKKLYAFLGSVVGGDLKTRDTENFDVKWFNSDCLPQIHIYQRELVAEALKILAQRANIDVPDDVKKAVNIVYAYAPELREWVLLKKELLKVLPTTYRTLFSTRDPLTKKQRPNAFEHGVADIWSGLVGHDIVFSNSDD